MRQLLIPAIVLVLVSAGFSAEALPSKPYAGLFVDQLHSGTSVYYSVTPLTPFTMYVWWLPSVSGMKAAEFQVLYPSNVLGGAIVTSSKIPTSLGDLAGGVSVAFADCQFDWVWSHQQTCYLMNADPSVILLGPHPTGGGLQVALCLNNYPIAQATALSCIYLNQAGPIAVQQSSWGAIKSLYR